MPKYVTYQSLGEGKFDFSVVFVCRKHYHSLTPILRLDPRLSDVAARIAADLNYGILTEQEAIDVDPWKYRDLMNDREKAGSSCAG
jgi:hypothetical protein